MVKIFLDDIRQPPGNDWIVVRTIEAFKEAVVENWNAIEVISWDHDLGEDDAGRYRDSQEAWNWLQNWMLDNDYRVEIPSILHSSNTSGGPYLMDKINRWNLFVRTGE